MNLETLFVREKREFYQLYRTVNDVFFLENRLPKQVFREPFRYFWFEEFDWTMDGDFWTVIQQLSKKMKDEYILTAVLDPHPVEYFYEEFGYYNWVKPPVHLTSDQYVNVLELGPKESPADAMLYNSYTVIWLPSSMKWAIWGDRNYGICILGLRDANHRVDAWPIVKTWRPMDQTVLSWVALNFANQQLPQEVVDSLFLHYSNEAK
ncbi:MULTISPECIES: hypothetical protein [Geobacillus]|uniref:hypothetical protein n=1 Tax=Geobacillus TaxID=129337 RepID=UPI000A7F9A1F|nr:MULTISPECIES: hypothetical protein [Geobacillus]MCG5026819.1 hypothetical protein [Anoxybacillus flavithermus]WMJ20691.1 hypothetical protein RA957_03930 [Geobacillus kaustophilus]